MSLKRVLIIGGYGNFGRYIAMALGQNQQLQLIIAGRRIEKAQAFIESFQAAHQPIAAYCDINQNIQATLSSSCPDIVIHTSGPFQGQGYNVVKACIEYGCHYIDLADSRDFVTGIEQFDAQAKEKKLFICSGASSVPGLSSAIIEHYKKEFSLLESVEYAIATAQLTNQGEATTAGVVSYAGKPSNTIKEGKTKTIYGVQGLRLKPFWQLNNRFLGYCDIPDLELFPKHYPDLKTIQFQAGLELKPLHLSLYLLSWLARLHLLPSLDKLSRYLLNISRAFNRFGHDDTGFYMILSGKGQNNEPKTIHFDIYAQHGDGLYIPCVPSIYLSEQLSSGTLKQTGATACVGIISLQAYLDTLTRLKLDIQWQENQEGIKRGDS